MSQALLAHTQGFSLQHFLWVVLYFLISMAVVQFTGPDNRALPWAVSWVG